MVAANLPAIYSHACDVYREMDKNADVVDGQRQWSGSLTKVVSGLGLSNPYYTHTTQALKAMDCIRQIRRGGGGQQSVWLLVQEPSPKLWSLVEKEEKKPTGKSAERDQRLRDMNERITQLENRMEIMEAKNG